MAIKPDSHSVELYLQELLQDQSSSRLKLLAAWDGLSIETQIKILNIVKRIPHELKIKALSSPNAYVRYLVAKHFCSLQGLDKDFSVDGTSEEKELFEKISTDTNILVKFTQCPSKKVHVCENNQFDLNPKNFFAMSKEEQIMYFSECSIRDGDDIAGIIEWGLKNNAIEQDHLHDLIVECATNFEKFKPFTRDYDYSGVKGLEALWNLVPKLGISKSARWLIWSLPSGTYSCDEIPVEVLNSLDQEILIELLEQPNIYLRDFRRKIVFSSNDQYCENIRITAASIHLELTNDDILNLIKNKNLDVINIIIKSGGDGEYGYYYGLSPVFIHALFDFKNLQQGTYEHGSYHYGFERFFNANTKDYTESDKKWFVKKKLCELAIYFIARLNVPWKSKGQDAINYMPEKFQFLKNKIVRDNTWETYMAFLDALDPPESYEEDLLPYVEKFSSSV
jgi:hypothetical protein